NLTWLSVQGSILRLNLLIQAGAKKNAVVGEYNGCLKLKIAAPPVEGAANQAIIAFLAGLLRVRKNQVRIVQGEFAKRKLLEVSAKDRPWRGEEVGKILLAPHA